MKDRKTGRAKDERALIEKNEKKTERKMPPFFLGVKKTVDIIKKLPMRIKAFPKKVKDFFVTLPQKLRTLRAFVKEEYTYWLYHGERKNLKNSGSHGRAGAVCVLFLLLFFALYYIGVFDIAFVERPEEWKQNAEKFFSIGKSEKTPDDNAPSLPDSENGSTEKRPGTVHSVDIRPTLDREEKEDKINFATVFKTDRELELEGYYLTDADYREADFEVGLMTFDFDLPERFTYRTMLKRDWVTTSYDDGRASTVEDTEVTVDRPAIYLYMGYVIYDDCGRNLYLLDNGGNVLMEYDENYIPAFARDKIGEPLFYSTYSYYADVPVASEENEAGEEIVTETRGAYLTGRRYFCLSYGGNYFVSTDYVEEREGRGLNFDFTSRYGITDSRLKRVGLISPVIATFLDGKSAHVNFSRWNYFSKYDTDIPDLEEIYAKQKAFDVLPVEEKLALIEEKKTPYDEYDIDSILPYTFAYNYRENYAVVGTKDPDITGEEPKYETEELRVINTYGEVMFSSRKKTYNNEIKDYCSERYLPPLSRGEDSIGHFYFDHGLLRVRKLSYDQFQLEEYKDFRVNSDKDILVYPSGVEFPLPEGYTVKGYSDGIIVLEKNGLYGYMNYNGKWIAEPEYEYASAFHAGVGVVRSKNGKYAALNTDGGFVLPFRYDYLSNRSDGLIAAYSAEKGWEVYGIFTK